MSSKKSDTHDMVHVWVGTNFAPEDEYLEYFELDYTVDIDDPSYKVCGFCKDIGDVWYDEDFIGIIPRKNKEVIIDEIIVDSAVDRDFLAYLKAQCLSLGILKANSIFWYSDDELEISKPIKSEYNGLTYVGLYKGE